MNIFEQATRRKVRFATAKGEISIEQLWDVPLTSKNGFDLDAVAKAVHADLKASGEESFVSSTYNPAKAGHELKMEVVKHVIAVKLAEQQEAATALARKHEKEKLLQILANKQDQQLQTLSIEEIQARINAL